jgi:hypothetical protein
MARGGGDIAVVLSGGLASVMAVAVYVELGLGFLRDWCR